MSQAPSMPMFWDAYLADTTHLTTEEHGAYLLLLAAMWRRNGSVPDDDRDNARILGLTQAKWRRIKERLEGFLVFENGEISQKNLQKIWKITQEKIEKNRENGAKGGRPKSNKNKDIEKAKGSVSVNPNDNPNETIPDPEPYKEREANASLKKVDFSEQKNGKPKDLFEDQTGATKSKPKAATRLPPEWTLPPDLAEWARSKGISSTKIQFEAEKFRDFWIAKSGKDATKTDWSATWRNWMRKFIDPGQSAAVDPYAHYGRRPAPTAADVERWDRMGRGHEKQGVI